MRFSNTFDYLICQKLKHFQERWDQNNPISEYIQKFPKRVFIKRNQYRTTTKQKLFSHPNTAIKLAIDDRFPFDSKLDHPYNSKKRETPPRPNENKKKRKLPSKRYTYIKFRCRYRRRPVIRHKPGSACSSQRRPRAPWIRGALLKPRERKLCPPVQSCTAAHFRFTHTREAAQRQAVVVPVCSASDPSFGARGKIMHVRRHIARGRTKSKKPAAAAAAASTTDETAAAQRSAG